MKNTFLKTIGSAALAILMLATFAQISVFAQDNDDEAKSDEQTQEDLATRRENTRKLEGVWNFQVTGRNCQTGAEIRRFPAMFTYMRGGTLNEFGSNPPSLSTHGMGIWRYESQRQYTSAHQFFRFNADGTLAGKQINRAEIQMSQDGDSFTTIGRIQVLDINGNVIQNNCATAIATRFQ